MNTNNAKIEDFQDNLLREVVVNYSTKSTQRFHFKKPEQVAEFARSLLVDNSREHFIALYLNTRHVVIGYSLLAIGSANMVTVHPREVYQRALLAGAFALIVAHNHPSNELEPSQTDCKMTELISNGSKLLGLNLLDHVIIAGDRHYSFRKAQPHLFEDFLR